MTDAPLFFLLVQLIIAVLLFGIADVLRILPNRLTLDLKICKGLVYVVGLNVLGLRYSSKLGLQVIVSNLHQLQQLYLKYLHQ